MAADIESDRLSLRWAALETQLVKGHGWFRLSQAARQAQPKASEMRKIERRLDRLATVQEHHLKALAAIPASDLHGVASKLAVAARLLKGEGGPLYGLVADAVRDLAARRCPGCGATYVPGAEPG